MTFQAEGAWFGHSTREGYFHFDSQTAYECPTCLTVLVPGPDTTVVSGAPEETSKPATARPAPEGASSPAENGAPSWQVRDAEEHP